MDPSSQSGSTLTLKIDLTSTEPFSVSNLRFKCSQGTTTVYTNSFSVNVQCGNYNNLLNTLASSSWQPTQNKNPGLSCYFEIPKANLDTRTSHCPISMQAFVSESDTTTQVSKFVGTGGAVASDVFKYYSGDDVWFWDSIEGTSYKS